jgi:hypothetical protein
MLESMQRNTKLKPKLKKYPAAEIAKPRYQNIYKYINNMFMKKPN